MTNLDGKTRREFVQITGAGLASAAVSRACEATRAETPGNKLVVGLIGCGGRGTHDGRQTILTSATAGRSSTARKGKCS
jgi:hypothetical protein